MIRSHVPENFTPNGPAAGMAGVGLTMVTCAKAIVGGMDAGPADLEVLTVAVREPADVQDPTDWYAYVFEVQTNHSGLADWFAHVRDTPREMDITHSAKPLPSLLYEVQTNMSNASGPLYTVHSAPTDARFPEEETRRHFFGPSAEENYLDTKASWVRLGGSQVADSRFSDQSTLFRVLGGLTTWPSSVNTYDSLQWEFFLPARPGTTG